MRRKHNTMPNDDVLDKMLGKLFDQCDDYQLYDAMGTATKILTTFADDDVLDPDLEGDLWAFVEQVSYATDLAREVGNGITAMRKKRQ